MRFFSPLPFVLLFAMNVGAQQSVAERQMPEVLNKVRSGNEKSVVVPESMVSPALTDREQYLLERIEKLESNGQLLLKEIETLKTRVAEVESRNAGSGPIVASERVAGDPPVPVRAIEKSAAAPVQEISEEDRGVLDFFRDTTVNFAIDGNYSYNFNRPYNRLNLLRAYDVTSNSFSLNQASVVVESAPNVEKDRRFGFRLDLQYGQATETLQGNPNNETRPQVYRPVWQAYGTYIAPIGKGLTVDFGKWGSSLGYETNYTKDNFNYSRSYFFNYLPYYHFGVRAAYPFTKKLTATYWLVNGTQQSEDFNSSKSQAILLTYKPTEKITLQGNYYVGEEQRDQQIVSTKDGDLRLTPRGRFHVLDAYATFLLSDKWTLAVEGDYVINRVNRNDAPSRVTGGVGYLRYQWTPKFAITGRGEYLSDRGGLFSGTTQILKEATLTADYKFAEGFLLRGEYRRDWSNRPYFLTNSLDVLKKDQNTVTLGFVWWAGQKKGAW